MNMRQYNMKLVPIGIVPEHIWKLQRYSALCETIDRYVEADVDVPSAWLKELGKLERELRVR